MAAAIDEGSITIKNGRLSGVADHYRSLGILPPRWEETINENEQGFEDFMRIDNEKDYIGARARDPQPPSEFLSDKSMEWV